MRYYCIINAVVVLLCVVLLFSEQTEALQLCNASIEIRTEKTMYLEEPIKFKPHLTQKVQNFLVEYWVEDLHGTIVKNMRNTTSLNLKSFTPKAGTGEKVFIIRAHLLTPDCENSGQEQAEQVVVYLDNQGKAEDGVCCPCATKKGLEYALDYLPPSVIPGEPFRVRVIFVNNDNFTHSAQLWSYVYRGSKSYSGDRIANIKTIEITAQNTVVAELENTVDAEPGEYSFKTKIKLDALKTEKELKQSIVVENTNIQFTPYIKDMQVIQTKDNGKLANLHVILNNPTFQYTNLTVVSESPYSFSEQSYTVAENQSVQAIMPVQLADGKNPIYVKLYLGERLVDIEEAVVVMDDKNKERPFNLITGDLMLNNSVTVYKSSSAKAARSAIIFIAITSVLFNMALLAKKRIS
ncbi:hypothetical protein KY320_01965 [Candidatus Woesearchaeota archaeon]|nr:hypothetical protein [Candidatus Woesearchaeota archaeon]